jgi:hypothetical protein
MDAGRGGIDINDQIIAYFADNLTNRDTMTLLVR